MSEKIPNDIWFRCIVIIAGVSELIVGKCGYNFPRLLMNVKSAILMWRTKVRTSHWSKAKCARPNECQWNVHWNILHWWSVALFVWIEWKIFFDIFQCETTNLAFSTKATWTEDCVGSNREMKQKIELGFLLRVNRNRLGFVEWDTRHLCLDVKFVGSHAH